MAGDPGAEPGILAQLIYLARPAIGFGELVPTRNNNMLPVPAVALPNPTVGPVVAFQRFPPIAGSGQ